MFPQAGDPDKMYFVDTRTKEADKRDFSMVTFELFHDAANNGLATIRPVFVMPGTLDSLWFELSASRDWFIFFKNPDEYLALLEVDLTVEDHTVAVGRQKGKTVVQKGYQPAFARDYDQKTGILTYIENPSMILKQARVTGERDPESGVLALDMTDIAVSESLKQVAEVNQDGATGFKNFVTSSNNEVWVFCDYQSSAGFDDSDSVQDAVTKVVILAKEQILTLTGPENSIEFGKYAWVSTDLADDTVDVVENDD